MRYNQQSPYLSDLIICRADFADRILAPVARATARRRTQDGKWVVYRPR